jgi:RimJ/RimL family protein N-acetyltransferase
MRIETERLLITDFTHDMAEAVHLNSLDEETRCFVPDEVFETIEDARETIEFLIAQYASDEGPYVHPIRLKNGENIGYVQLVKTEKGWEIGYHVAKQYTGNGYATEAVRAFIPVIAAEKHLSEVYGICLADNNASIRVLEKCNFKEISGACIDKYQYQGMDRPIKVFVLNIGGGMGMLPNCRHPFIFGQLLPLAQQHANLPDNH